MKSFTHWNHESYDKICQAILWKILTVRAKKELISVIENREKESEDFSRKRKLDQAAIFNADSTEAELS